MSLSPRLVAIQGIEFSPIQIATQGLLDYIGTGGTTHRPKSTNTLKLRRILDGRATALSAKALTRARVAQAGGAHVPQPPAAVPGRAVCGSAHTAARARAVSARGGASAMCGTARSRTETQTTGAAGGASAMCGSARTRARGTESTACGGAHSGLAPFRSFTSAGAAQARGVRNLSDAEVIAVVRVTIDKRR